MITKEEKLIRLFDFYMEWTKPVLMGKNPDEYCPFFRDDDGFGWHRAEYHRYLKLSCSKLCGAFKELKALSIDGHQDCPCRKWGCMEAIERLEQLLIREGYIDA